MAEIQSMADTPQELTGLSLGNNLGSLPLHLSSLSKKELQPMPVDSFTEWYHSSYSGAIGHGDKLHNANGGPNSVPSATRGKVSEDMVLLGKNVIPN